MTTTMPQLTLLTKSIATLAAAAVLLIAGTARAATYETVDFLAHDIHDQTHFIGEFAEARLDSLRGSAALRGDVRVICLATDRITRQAERCGNVHAIYGDSRALARRVEIMERHFDIMARDLDCAPPCVQRDYVQALQMVAALCNQAQLLEAQACALRDGPRHGHGYGHVAAPHRVGYAPQPYAPQPEFAIGVDRPRVGFSVASDGCRGTDVALRIGGFQLRLDD